MTIEPNSKLQYKNGKQRVSVLFHNRTDKGIFFEVRIQQSSRNFTGGDGYYCSEMTQPIQGAHEDTINYVNAAIEANS